MLGKASVFFVYLLAMLLLSFVVGQLVAISLFIAVYLWRWGDYGWRMSLGYAACGGLFLYGFYDRIMHILWQPSLLDDVYAGLHEWATAALHGVVPFV